MKDAIHSDLVIFDFKQDSIISHAQSVFRSEVGQLLDVTTEIVLQRFQLRDHATVLSRGQGFEVFDGSRFELDLIDHVAFSTLGAGH